MKILVPEHIAKEIHIKEGWKAKYSSYRWAWRLILGGSVPFLLLAAFFGLSVAMGSEAAFELHLIWPAIFFGLVVTVGIVCHRIAMVKIQADIMEGFRAELEKSR